MHLSDSKTSEGTIPQEDACWQPMTGKESVLSTKALGAEATFSQLS